MTFEEWQQSACEGQVRFFSLGRHAMAVALRAAGIGEGDAVLLPEFICRDVLASLHMLGAKPVWYEVGDDLRPASGPEAWPEARAVVAVDYFGFPQPLAPFQAYANRTGSLIVEDNAHGLFSKDEDGCWLGTRADIGIFSLRKTLPLTDGAMLSTNDDAINKNLPKQLPEIRRQGASRAAFKVRLRKLPGIGVASAAAATGFVRALRKLRTGHAVAPSAAADEATIPISAPPHVGLAGGLAAIDVDREIERRRNLYQEAQAAARTVAIEPLFPELPGSVSPYGFAFHDKDEHAAGKMRGWAARHGLDVIRWPALPGAIAARDQYRPLWLINFL